MKYVVTAFDKIKNRRAIISHPLSKSKATNTARSLANDMLIAKPEYRNLSKIRVEPLSARTVESAIDEQDLTWCECYSSELKENFVIHIN